VDVIAAALNQPYVDGAFEDEEYRQMYLAQLKAMNRSYYLHAVGGKPAVRWWKKQPDDLQILNDRVAVAWRAAHPATGNNPCDKPALPSNNAAHPDARASTALNQPTSPARAGGCER